jgi:hypothetical protein
LHTHHVFQAEFREGLPKAAVDSVTRVGHHHAARNVVLDRPANLLERDLRLGLKLYLVGNAGFGSALLVGGPNLG